MVSEARAEGDDRPFGLDDITDPDGFTGVSGSVVFTRDGRNTRQLAVMRATSDGPTLLETTPGGALPAAAAALAADTPAPDAPVKADASTRPAFADGASEPEG